MVEQWSSRAVASCYGGWIFSCHEGGERDLRGEKFAFMMMI